MMPSIFDFLTISKVAKPYNKNHGFRLDDILEKTGFERNKAIEDAKEAINENDETRKRFEIIARDLFRKFKACLTKRY